MKTEKQLIEGWGGSIEPVVSICCITYNHENYIEQALQSFLMQETSFPFEIVIHDDASPDNTADIIRRYEKEYPNIIKPLYQTENQKSKFKGGMNPRFNYPRAKGIYLAMCDGDDYWTDPHKLQKQVDFLEANPEYVLCHTDVKIDEKFKIHENRILKCWNYQDDNLDYRLAIFSPLAFTCTALFRNIKFRDERFYKIMSGDWMLWIKLTLYGKAKFLKAPTAVYRKGVGVSVNAIWHTDFNVRARFLLNQLSLNFSFIKNIWLIKGAIYFQLLYFSKKYHINYLNKIGSKLKYKISENR